MGIDPRLYTKRKGGPTFKVKRKILEHYLHFYSIFLKENYQQFKEKMFNLLMHVHDSNKNFNTLMNKREIDNRNTSDNMHQLLTDFEKLKGKCFSFEAFTDHVNACLERRGRSATTSMWGYVCSHSNSKHTLPNFSMRAHTSIRC